MRLAKKSEFYSIPEQEHRSVADIISEKQEPQLLSNKLQTKQLLYEMGFWEE